MHFLERNQEWYQVHRDLPNPSYCRLDYYDTLDELRRRFDDTIAEADAVMVGSYVPEGAAVCKWVTKIALGTTAFYDIDTPITVKALEHHDCDYLSSRTIPDFDLYLSFSGGPLLEVLRDRYDARSVHPLYCSAEVQPVAERNESWNYDLGYLGTYSADRQPTLDRLLIAPAAQNPHQRFAVVGPQYPESIDWPSNIERQSHLPPDRHPGFYRDQRFTLNVTRQAMIEAGYSPSVRLFEAAACGTPILTDAWPGLSDIFVPGKEILVAKSSAEVCEYLHDLPETARRSVADKAWFRFMRQHTPEQRAISLENWIMETSRGVLPVESAQSLKASQPSYTL